MLRSLLLTLVLCAAASPLLATTAAVEHPGALPVLLGLDSVRTELKLDSLQRAVLDSLRDEYKSAVRKLTNPLPATPEQRVAAEKQLVGINERFNKRALSALSDGQRKRLQEVEHQILGATKLYSPSVQSKIALTDQQKQAIEAIRLKGLAYVGQVNHQFEDGQISFQDRLGLLRSRRVSQGTALFKVLTPAQRSAFLALGGRKFAI
jgi:hypothetical protein